MPDDSEKRKKKKPAKKAPRREPKKPRKKNVPTKTSPIQRAERKRTVARLALQGFSIREIAAEIPEELGSSPATVARDLAEQLEAWRAEQAGITDEALTLDLVRIERLIQAHWPEAINGDMKAGTFVMGCIAQKAKLLGFEKDPVLGRLSQLSEDELWALATGGARRTSPATLPAPGVLDVAEPRP